MTNDDRKLDIVFQFRLSRQLARAFDLESTKAANERGVSINGAKASMAREALIAYLAQRGCDYRKV